MPGGVVGVMSKNLETPLIVHGGRLSYDADAPEVAGNTVYDVASLTKVVPTSLLTLMFIDQGHIELDGLMTDYLPGYRGAYRDAITIKHLLSYTVDWGVSMSSLAHLKADEIYHTLYNATPRAAPGTSTHYCNATAILLGLILERVSGVRLDRLGKEMLFDPLHMKRTGFAPAEFADIVQDVAPSEQLSEGKVCQGVVHDESARALQSADLIPGSAGVFSTVPDLLQVVGLLLDHGVYDSRPILSDAVIEQAMKPAFENTTPSMGLGWSVGPSETVGHVPASAVYKTGFTGCLMYVDVEAELGVVVLTNHTFPTRQPDYMLRNQLFQELLETVTA